MNNTRIFRCKTCGYECGAYEYFTFLECPACGGTLFDVKQEADYTQVRGRIIEDSIDSYINHGNKYPYDMDDEGNFDAPVNWAVRASRGIIDEFMERNGFDEMLEDVSEGTRKDIIVNMSNIIMRVAKQALTSNNFSIGEIE